MTYPAEIYKGIKPKITMEQALEKAKARKPSFSERRIKITGKDIDTVIENLLTIKGEHGNVKVLRESWSGDFVAVIREQVPVERVARGIKQDDLYRWQRARRDRERRHDFKLAQAERVANTMIKHCPCCVCSKGQ